MAVDLDWSLLTNASQNFGNALTGAASQIRQHRQTATDEGNLSNYLQQPDNPKAFNAVAAHNPQLAYQIQDHHLEAARNLRADHAQQLDTVGQILAPVYELAQRPGTTPEQVQQAYQQAVSLAHQGGIDVTGHETYDPAFVSGVVQLHQRLHPVAPVNVGRGDLLVNPQTGATVARGAPPPEQVVPIAAGGGLGVFHPAWDGSPGTSSVTPQPAVAAPTAPVPPTGGGSASGRGITALNNPGALEDGPFARSQPGYVAGGGRFAHFSTPEAGVAAQEALLAGHYQGRSINSLLRGTNGHNGYTPVSPENPEANVRNYEQYISQRTGLDVNAPIPPARMREVAAAMREFETGHRSAHGAAHVQTAQANGRTYYQNPANGQWYDNSGFH